MAHNIQQQQQKACYSASMAGFTNYCQTQLNEQTVHANLDAISNVMQVDPNNMQHFSTQNNSIQMLPQQQSQPTPATIVQLDSSSFTPHSVGCYLAQISQQQMLHQQLLLQQQLQQQQLLFLQSTAAAALLLHQQVPDPNVASALGSTIVTPQNSYCNENLSFEGEQYQNQCINSNNQMRNFFPSSSTFESQQKDQMHQTNTLEGHYSPNIIFPPSSASTLSMQSSTAQSGSNHAVETHAPFGTNQCSSLSANVNGISNVNPMSSLSSLLNSMYLTASSIPHVRSQLHYHLHTILSSRNIPHYIPPIPPIWGGQVPSLTVQDRPLVPPIYNGINPNYPGAQILHSNPPVYCITNFLSPAECDFLISAASDAFGPAPVVGKGAGEVSPSRTSSTCYLAREDLPEYLRKITLLTGKPVEHCELPQVGRYLPSQQYLQHFDAFDLTNDDGRRFASNGGQRTVTVLTYLNDVVRGGATFFPNINLEVQPRCGMALVFFPSTIDGLLDKMTLHAALPAVDIKYVSQVWIRQSNYDGRPSKRLLEPMVAGLQERRDLEQLESSMQKQMLIGQLGFHQQLQMEFEQSKHHQ